MSFKSKVSGTIKKVRAGLKKTFNPTTAQIKAKTERVKAKTDYRNAVHQQNLTRGGVKGAYARHIEGKMRKQRIEEGKAQGVIERAKQQPKLDADVAKIEAKAKGQAAVAKAKAAGQTAAAGALAPSIAVLGRGLSDENNQDDAADRKTWETIFGSKTTNPDTGKEVSSTSGLTEGSL